MRSLPVDHQPKTRGGLTPLSEEVTVHSPGRTAGQRLGITLFALLGIVGCSRCETMDDEAAIRAVIERTAARAEAADVKGIMEAATGDFKVVPQGLNQQKTRVRLLFFFRQSGRVSIVYPRPAVNIDRKTRAYAEVNVPFALKRKGKSFPDLNDVIDDPEAWMEKVDAAADLYHLELWFIKKSDEWRVRKARIRQGL